MRPDSNRHPSVLVLGGLGDIARSIVKVLQANFVELRVFLADARAPDFKASSVYRLPTSDNHAYPTELKALVNELRPDVVLPTNEREIARLAQDDIALGTTSRVLLETREHLRVFGDKLLTYDWCVSNGIPTIPTVLASGVAEVAFPLLLKPREGSGSRNQIIIDRPAALESVLPTLNDSFVVQPLVAGAQEFTCVAARAGFEIRTLVLERRLHAGRSRWVRVAEDSGVIWLAERMAALVRPNYSVNFQFLKSESDIFLIDVNPRFSSTVAMRDALGFADLVWTIKQAFGLDPGPWKSPTVGTVVEWADDDGEALVLRPATAEAS